MELNEVLTTAVDPALALLPPRMDSPQARVMLLAIGLQESRFLYRHQLDNGPARGLWQFERGTKASRGGVWGVYLHKDSNSHLERLCASQKVPFLPEVIWSTLERNDILAAGVARLLLATDPYPLPAVDDAGASWDLYAKRTWRPGKPHPETWPGFHQQAREALGLA
jgi:hypothetical protein